MQRKLQAKPWIIKELLSKIEKKKKTSTEVIT